LVPKGWCKAWKKKGPLQQYVITGDDKKFHKLSFPPSKTRSTNEEDIHKPKLHRDELSMIKELIELARKLMQIKDYLHGKPNTQSNQPGTIKCVGLKPVLPQTQNKITDQALIYQIRQELDAFLMIEGKISHCQAALVLKFLHFSSKTFPDPIASMVVTAAPISPSTTCNSTILSR
jgi:hypothetical protein